MFLRTPTRLSTTRSSVAWAGAILLIYGISGSYSWPQHIDTATSSIQAWALVTTGSFDLSPLPVPDNLWLTEGERGLVADRMPGPILASVPAYFLSAWFAPGTEIDSIRDIPIWPANLTAVLLAWAAVLAMWTALRRLVDDSTARLAATIFALGTAVWSVSANAMWTHTVSQPAIALAALSLSRSRTSGAGLAFAFGTVGRLHVSAIALGVGARRFVRDRSVSPLLLLGLATSLGLLAAAVYYQVALGSPTPTSVDHRAENIAEGGASGPLWVPVTLVMLLASPDRGLLPWTPVILPLLPALTGAWKRAPAWVQGLALGGGLQLIVQAMVQPDWTGGNLHFGSRLTLEALTAWTPLLTLAYVQTREGARPSMLRLVHIGAGLSVLLHGLGATVLARGMGRNVVQFPWW